MSTDTLSGTRLSTPEEAGLRIGKTAYWMNQKAREGRIPCTMFGRTRMFSEANLDAIIASFHVEPTAEAPRHQRKNRTA